MIHKRRDNKNKFVSIFFSRLIIFLLALYLEIKQKCGTFIFFFVYTLACPVNTPLVIL